MTPQLKDRVYLVTGSAGGIGAATAQVLVRRGAAVVMADLDPDRIEQAAVGVGERAVDGRRGAR